MFQDAPAPSEDPKPEGWQPGWAPEMGQNKLKEEEEKARQAAEALSPTLTIFNTEWWVLKEGEKEPSKMMGQDLQNFLNENAGANPNVCSVAETQAGKGKWTLASTNGFTTTEAPQKEVVGEVGVDLAKSPEEEALETLPDEELFQLAKDRLLLQFDADGKPDRAATVKVLALSGVKI